MGEQAVDILKELPVWAQVAANLGMFAVAVAVSAFGFVKRLGASAQYSMSIDDKHFEEGGALHEVGQMFRDLISAQLRIASALEAQIERQRRIDENARIESEVERRLNDRAKLRE